MRKIPYLFMSILFVLCMSGCKRQQITELETTFEETTSEEIPPVQTDIRTEDETFDFKKQMLEIAYQCAKQSDRGIEGLFMDLDADGCVEMAISVLKEDEAEPEQWMIYHVNENQVQQWMTVELCRPYREFWRGTDENGNDCFYGDRAGTKGEEVIQFRPQWSSSDKNFEELLLWSIDYPRIAGVGYNASGTDFFETAYINGIRIGMEYDEVQKILGKADYEGTPEESDNGWIFLANYGQSVIRYQIKGERIVVFAYYFNENMVDTEVQPIKIGSTRQQLFEVYGDDINFEESRHLCEMTDQQEALKDDMQLSMWMIGRYHYGNVIFYIENDIVTEISASSLSSV